MRVETSTSGFAASIPRYCVRTVDSVDTATSTIDIDVGGGKAARYLRAYDEQGVHDSVRGNFTPPWSDPFVDFEMDRVSNRSCGREIER